MTSTEESASTGRAIRSRCSARCAPHGPRIARCRCVSPAMTGRQGETRRKTRHSLPSSSRKPAPILSIVRQVKSRRPSGQSMAACSRRRSPTRSATRRMSTRSPSAPFPKPITSIQSLPRAEPTFARSPGRILPIPPGRCTRSLRSASPTLRGPSNIFPPKRNMRRTSRGPPQRRPRRHDRQASRRPSCAGDRRGKRHRRRDRAGSRSGRRAREPRGAPPHGRSRRSRVGMPQGSAVVVDSFDVTSEAAISGGA